MLELLLTAQNKPGPVGGNSDGFFTYEGFTEIPFTYTLASGVAFETTPSIDTATLGGQLGVDGNARSFIKFNRMVDLASTDWTLEYSSIIDNVASDYCGEIALSLDQTTANYAMVARFGSPGFGNRYQIATGGTLTDVFSSIYTKAQMVNKLKRIAFVKTSAGIALYIDGVRQMMAISVGTSYTYANAIPVSGRLNNVGVIVLGPSYSMQNAKIRIGPVRLTASALYTADYTPVPF